MTHKATASLSLTAALALCACAQNVPENPTNSAAVSPQDAFWQALSSRCGKAYAGALVSEDAADADFADADMLMHVRECSDERITVPFHVASNGRWDRSRTWVFTRTANGLRLKHDHRHEDGESDAVTMYGGDTASEGTAREQDFPVDTESIALFRREGLSASISNVWTIEIDPADAANATFAYQLKRTVSRGAPEPRFFRVEFALDQPVDVPPPAWGWD